MEGDDLTVGVFGPAQMLGRAGAATVIEGVVSLLRALV